MTDTTTEQTGPGRLVDPKTGLRVWNSHLVFAGHLADGEALARIDISYPQLRDSDTHQLSRAFHEHVQPKPEWDSWLYCAADEPGAMPVTVFILSRLDTEGEDEDV